MSAALPPVHPETFAAQAGGDIDGATGAIVPPLHVSTTYLRDTDNNYSKGYIYGRPDNLTVRQAEAVLTRLEGGAATLLSGSGMTAATAAFLALDRSAPSRRAHVIAPDIMYWGLKHWLKDDAPAFGIDVTFVDMSRTETIAAAVRPGYTKMIWLETPSNPLWSLADISAAATLAHDHGALLGVDSTVATPVLTQPLALGADVVMHSATKYLNGHGDVLAGSLTFARTDDFYERVVRGRKMLGGIIGPFEAMLLMRGMRTLHLRVAHQSGAAMRVARHFAADPRVASVLYPGLETHPGHALAARQMKGGYSGMLSIRLKGGEAAAIRAAAHVRVWKRATSLGGVESLIEHRASIEGADSLCPLDLLRLSVGLELVDDLIADLDQALGANA